VLFGEDDRQRSLLLRTKVYTGTMQASYHGRVWRAQWWTQNEEPGIAQVWVNTGPC
jgi:chitodextrinase